jgi:hypothetical protein
MSEETVTFSVGDKVLHALHVKDHAGWSGIITASEIYTDFHGSRRWLYVQWMDPHGRLLDEQRKYHPSELRKAGQ